MVMKLKLEAHDLLWGMTVDCLADVAPLWVKEVLLRGDPVVVRREITPEDQVAVGIRGQFRSQRYAAQMPRSAIGKQLKPEALIRVDTQQFEHLAERLQSISSIMKNFSGCWGYTGSFGFELATGIKTVTPQSDIDLLIRAEQSFAKKQAIELLENFHQAGLNVDIQLQLPQGGLALKEWARNSGKVLLKRPNGAVLVENPWN
ncbi:malonate decarboxylase holo-ACP synthase [Acinetobacter nosocomialis]|uniref:malonate decarboxylase holo-ACP synthase n=1 Tax=Acinetobacter nosocomialis TaxID=106654 RepID=UPI00111F080D|nr:malonate decarboxylase holo-ACP synthase [Acinetobacter nosocomialis]MDC9814957.1 malonate decarboxylase holo-ACP synthase [Acinetobacter nosocomialis]MDE1703993.1 malonate decarboxylase holo-ACP synthase [Acinetobacter nosocomialis]MDE9404177.1 malonate decarboxylase holo-ACP synthase [Acinetobacter nosocomialis]HDG7210572.1 malonate decarboxylase holo-ACP synthase [Acinetobacter nosocomialis]HDG9760728.1 malonate decarboxylase holo-ACP synthase [Acinetobacter nosocomialis]